MAIQEFFDKTRIEDGPDESWRLAVDLNAFDSTVNPTVCIGLKFDSESPNKFMYALSTGSDFKVFLGVVTYA